MNDAIERTKNNGEHHGFAYGNEYLVRLSRHETDKFNAAGPKMAAALRQDCPILGTALSVLHQLSTCHRGCRGGDHILEALIGRGYNLACAALILSRSSYYDEALGLIRSIGEIANLLAFFYEEPSRYNAWLQAAPKERINNYSPSDIRKAVLKTGVLPMDTDWYNKLCETATHVTPATFPNRHNDFGKGYVGGTPQEEGLRNCVGQVATITVVMATFAARMLGQEDLLKKLLGEIDSLDRQDAATQS